MGRRKIEIQPIIQERNRSVTFQKRKHGLFKKAYELGVLCSIDIAIIIVEQRPGRDQKFYEYCSTNIRDIVDRHQQHGGERDIRRPSDYATGATNGDMEDAEEDDVDVAAGSPILLNSISMKRGPDDEQFKASIGDTGDRIHSNPYSLPRLIHPLHAEHQSKKPRLTLATFPDTLHGYPYDPYSPIVDQHRSTPTSSQPNGHREKLIRSAPSSSHILDIPHLRYPVPYLHHPPPSHTTPPPFLSPSEVSISSTSTAPPSILSHSRTGSSFDTPQISHPGYISPTAVPGGGPRSGAQDILTTFFGGLEQSKGAIPSALHSSVALDSCSASASGSGLVAIPHADARDPLQWPFHTANARGYPAASNGDAAADWLELLSGLNANNNNTSTGANSDFIHQAVSERPYNFSPRLPTPSSPISFVPGDSAAQERPRLGDSDRFFRGSGGDGRWGSGEDSAGLAHRLAMGRAHVHVKEEVRECRMQTGI